MHSGAGPLPFTALVGMAVRRNPKRAHLLVSTVLGKHVPTDPRLVLGAGLLLGVRVADALSGVDSQLGQDGTRLLAAALAGSTESAVELVRRCHRQASRPGVPSVVLGFAETATALGHAVADVLSADFLHSTRRQVAGRHSTVGFEESHSHASQHLLLPEDPLLLRREQPMILVDDEFSTGSTACNAIRALHRIAPGRRRYLLATLVDLRDEAEHAAAAALAAELGVRIEVVALASGRLELPADILHRAARIIAAYPPVGGLAGRPSGERRSVPAGRVFEPAWPSGVPEGGRHGIAPAHRAAFESAVTACATELADRIEGFPGPAEVLVLGCEELMYAPLRIATVLADLLDRAGRGDRIRYSSTTRSPVVVIDEAGYAVRSALEFPAHDRPADGPGRRYAYNIGSGRYTDIVLIVDELADTPELATGLSRQLAGLADRFHQVRLPTYQPAEVSPEPARYAAGAVRTATARPAPGGLARPELPQPLHGPAFSSYAAAEVSWLVTDLSQARLEAPIELREQAIQTGRAHYAESLPIEYQPMDSYKGVFEAVLAASADRVATAVGIVTELLLARRGKDIVLVSLARAGTPIGILMRRWAQLVHGIQLRHYTVSIVRGRGIDRVALSYLAAHHDPAAVAFVDGWTGKGAIVRELTSAVAEMNRELDSTGGSGRRFSDQLAVLADTGSCVELFGTREDYLIPSACLNSTVSGLVSRTVLNPALVGPGRFHGAKFYPELREADVSNRFLDTISGRFRRVQTAVRDRVHAVLAGRIDTTPTWQGWAETEQIAQRYGIGDVNLVKPGIGETTRVLLRRVPWRVLIRADAMAELEHVLLLAAQRGVPVEPVAGLSYSCIGLIRPYGTGRPGR